MVCQVPGAPVATDSGVLAELVFEVQPGATGQYLWPIRLRGGELTPDGYDLRALVESRLEFSARPPLPGRLRWEQEETAGCRFYFEGDIGAGYVIEVSDDLEHWTTLREFVREAAPFDLSDEETGQYSSRFFRARIADSSNDSSAASSTAAPRAWNNSRKWLRSPSSRKMAQFALPAILLDG